MLLFMISACAINLLISIYLSSSISFSIAIVIIFLALLSLAITFDSQWKTIIQIIMYILMIGTSFGSMAWSIASVNANNQRDHTHHEIVKKESENKRLKQVIDREVSKQLDQRMDEINHRK